jgi:hypothetical protein
MINMAPIAKKNARHTAAILSWVPKLGSERDEKQSPIVNRFDCCRRLGASGFSRRQSRDTNGPIGFVGAIALIEILWFNRRWQTQPLTRK